MPYEFSTWDRNCLEEHVTPLEGSVTGSIPSWLRGSYILNGPGRMTYGENEFKHVFDGSALLQKFNITETGVTYNSRFLRSYAYTTNLEHGQIVVSEFGTTGKSVTKSKLGKLGDKFAFDKMFSDNAPVGVVKFGGEYYCVTEAPFLHKIDPTTLETISKVDLHKELNMNSHCPNPHVLPDGTTYNVLHMVGPTGPRYDIVTFPPTPQDSKTGSVFTKPKKVGSVDARWKLNPCHMHSFGMTENYFVLLEQPMTIDVKAMVANTIRDKPFIGGMEWMNNKLIKIHLVHRETGKEVKQKVKCEAFFFMHIVNCYEQDNHVVIDVNGYGDTKFLHALHLKNIRENPNLGNEMDSGNLKRIVVPLEVNDKATPELNLVMIGGSKAKAHRQKDGSLILTPDNITDYSYEIPTLNPAFLRKKYKYSYGTKGDMKQTQGQFGKVDLESREVKDWGESGLYASVSCFLPRPGATAEDDGVIIGTVLHSDDKAKVTLVVLNAADMTELARVSFITASQVPRSLHGCFLPA